MKTTSILILATTMLGFGAFQKDAVGQEPQSPLSASPAPAAVLTAQPAGFAFGRVPIAGGNVTTRFVVTNVADRPVRLERVYTSCNCTTASLEFSDGGAGGPFGMPGHELPTEYDRTVQPGESFEVQVYFNPAAHGPRGIGSVTRSIVLAPANDPPLEFVFTVTVVGS